MTQEEKQLLLKDLSARLPYHTKIDTGVEGIVPLDATLYELNRINLECGNDVFLPYLRQMSSMTEEERDEVKEICADYLDEWENAETIVDRWKLDAKTSYLRSAFYNSHHLDWNGLIEKGLALEAPKNMYDISFK